MPGLPSTVSETESPTGCTKQLISVTSRMPEPAAELIRPPGMKPRSSASRNAGLVRRGIGLDRRERACDAPAHRAGGLRPVEVRARHPWRISRAGRRDLPPARQDGGLPAAEPGFSGLFIGEPIRGPRTEERPAASRRTARRTPLLAGRREAPIATRADDRTRERRWSTREQAETNAPDFEPSSPALEQPTWPRLSWTTASLVASPRSARNPPPRRRQAGRAAHGHRAARARPTQRVAPTRSPVTRGAASATTSRLRRGDHRRDARPRRRGSSPS